MFGVARMPIVTVTARTKGAAQLGRSAVGRTRCTFTELGRSECGRRTNAARLLVVVGLVADLASAAARQYCPFAVAFAQVRGRFGGVRILDAHARLLFDNGDFATGRRLVEVREILGDRRTRYIVHLDREHTDACALIPKRKVNALFRHRNAFHLAVDVNV